MPPAGTSKAADTGCPEARWRILPQQEDSLAKLRDSPLAAEHPDLLLRLIAQRGGADEAEARRYLFPKLADLSDPFLLPGMTETVERIFQAVDRQEKVLIFGDYDVDGVTSTTLARSALGAYGLHVDAFVPHRITEGYGLSISALEICLEKWSPDLVIAIDCGTNNHAETAWLKERGVDALVLDHHEVGPDGPAECCGVVNAKRGTEFTYFCSAGIVFKVIHALLKTRLPEEGFDLKNYLDLVAVGTISDIVPLIDENRILVRKGLGCLSRRGHPGLTALMKVAGVPARVLSSHISFRLGPRINAAGRIDNALHSLKLMLEGDNVKAFQRAQVLDVHNRNRQDLERRIVAEAEQQLVHEDSDGRASIVLGSDGWHPGVVGIVASRIMKAWHRPAIVIGFDKSGLGKGSGRSVPGVNLVAALERCREYLVSGGGHEQAVGVTVRRECFDQFRTAFEEAIKVENSAESMIPEIKIDQVIEFADIPYEFLDHHEFLEPFGSGNSVPVFAAGRVYPAAEPRYLGQEMKHLKLLLSQNGHRRDAIWFNAVTPLPPPPWDIAFTIERNEYRGSASLQYQLRDLRSSSGG